MSRGDNVQGILSMIGPFWAKRGLGRVQWSLSFFSVVIQRTFWQLRNGRFSPNLAAKRSSVSRWGIWKDIFENFNVGIIYPWNLKSKIRQTGTSLKAGYRSRDAMQRDIVIHVVVQGPGSFRDQSTFCMTSCCGATGRQICPIFTFWPIFPIQNAINVPSGDQPTAQGLHYKMITISPCGCLRSKGVPCWQRHFPATSGRRAGDPQNLSKLSSVANGNTHAECYHTAHQIWSRKWLKTCNSEDGCTFPSKYLCPYPQNHPKAPFWGTFQCKTYYRYSSPQVTC